MLPRKLSLRSHFQGLAVVAALVLTPTSGNAERYKLSYVPGTPQAEILELMEQQYDTTRKLELMQRFVKAYPTHPAVSHLYEWMQSYHARRNDHREVLQFGEKLLALHPEDTEALWRCKRAAEALGDATAVKLWMDRLVKVSEKIVVATPPKTMDAETWAKEVETAKALLAEREYEIFRKALEITEPRDRAARLEAFNSMYPASTYVKQTYPYLLHAYRAIGDSIKTLAMAEKVLRQDPDNLDALLAGAQIYMDRRSNYPKVIANAARVVDVATAKSAPEGTKSEEWERHKGHYLGSAYLLMGNAYVNTNSFPAADKALRLALPYLKGTGSTEAAVLFYLGWSNYHLERYKEAATYFRACLPHGGVYAEQANKNLVAMKGERRISE